MKCHMNENVMYVITVCNAHNAHCAFSPPELSDYTLAPEKFDFNWQLMFLFSSFAINNNCENTLMITT